jgi:hypothetical protein
VYTYTAKWHEESDEYKRPAAVPVVAACGAFERVGDIARRAYRAVGCRDYARADVRMDAGGGFHVLEVNPNPYLNSLALVNGLLAVGSSYERLVVEHGGSGAGPRRGARARRGGHGAGGLIASSSAVVFHPEGLDMHSPG